MTTWRVLNAAEFRVLAFLLSQGPAGTPIRMNDTAMARGAGYIRKNGASTHVASLCRIHFPGSNLPIVDCTGWGTPIRTVWVNVPPAGPSPTDGHPHVPRRGLARKPGSRKKGGGA